MKKNVVAIITMMFAVLSIPTPMAHASAVVKPQIEVEAISTTGNQQILRLVGVNAEAMDAIDLEVRTTEKVAITEVLPFQGELTTVLSGASSKGRVMEFSWKATADRRHRREPLADIYLVSNGQASSIISVHVTECVVGGYMVEGIRDTEYEIRFPVAPEQASQPMVDIVYSTDSEVCIHTRGDDGAIAVIAFYDEHGKSISTRLKSVAEMPVDGRGYRLWVTTQLPKEAERAKVMLVDRCFRPLCEPVDEELTKNQ